MARSELESSMKSIKYILLIITTMFIAVSTLMIILGVSVYSKYNDFSFNFVSGQNFFTPSVLVTITGAAMLLITLFGFIGSLRESTCLVNVVCSRPDFFTSPIFVTFTGAVMLFFTLFGFVGGCLINVFSLIVGVMLILQVVVIAIGFTVDEDAIVQYVHVPVDQYTTSLEVRDEIDYLQSSLKCCGSSTFYDYVGQEFTSEHKTVFAQLQVMNLTVPQTCCYKYIQGDTYGYCDSVWNVGCTTALVGLIVQNSGVLGVLAVSVVFIQLLGVIFGVLLAKCIRKVKSERAYLRWKLMEHSILGRRQQKSGAGLDLPPFIYIEHAQSTRA